MRDWGEQILRKGIDLMVIATGAYGDPALWRKHLKAAEKSGEVEVVPVRHHVTYTVTLRPTPTQAVSSPAGPVALELTNP